MKTFFKNRTFLNSSLVFLSITFGNTEDIRRNNGESGIGILTMNSANSEEDLYFEMEFDSKKEEDVSSPSARSVESLGTASLISGLSQDTEAEAVMRDERRGSSVGPILERPKYLRYKIWIGKAIFGAEYNSNISYKERLLVVKY